MKILPIFMLCILFLNASGQDLKISDQEIQAKLDSIKAEANLLYSYENASLNSENSARKNKKIKKDFGGSLTYFLNDTVKTVILNKLQNQVTAEYFYLNDSPKPIHEKTAARNLNDTETELLTVKKNLFEQLSAPEYKVNVPENFTLDLVTIPFGNGFRNYIITGTQKSGIIPVGNDYLFITDRAGKIQKWKKFHSRLIPVHTTDGKGNYTVTSVHSHLKTSPFISATEICTFRLYARSGKLNKLSVYSTALETYLTYDQTDNALQKTDIPLMP